MGSKVMFTVLQLNICHARLKKGGGTRCHVANMHWLTGVYRIISEEYGFTYTAEQRAKYVSAAIKITKLNRGFQYVYTRTV